MTAFGYVRKSVMADDSTTLSPAVQEDRIRGLASAHGDDDITILRDLDVSGAKVEERHDYMALVAAIESGDASAVYAYDLSRLHRNTREALRFFEIAATHNVPVRLVAESIDTSGPTGELMLTILAAMNAWTSKVTSAKITASMAMKRARGEHLGGRHYGDTRVITNADGTTRIVGEGEDPSAVIDAYRDTGSPLRAARLLNAAGVPTRNGKSLGWTAAAVVSVVSRLAPELIREDRAASAKVKGSPRGERSHRFARLLRCSVCGAILTPSVDRARGRTRYYCHTAATTPHGRTGVNETAIIKAMYPALELTALNVKRSKQGTADDEAALADLDAKKERAIMSFIEGNIDKAMRDSILADVEAKASTLTAMRWIKRIEVPPMIEDAVDDDGTLVKAASPAVVNAYLRRVFNRITVDMDTPGRKGLTSDIVITPEWRDASLRMDDATG